MEILNAPFSSPIFCIEEILNWEHKPKKHQEILFCDQNPIKSEYGRIEDLFYQELLSAPQTPATLYSSRSVKDFYAQNKGFNRLIGMKRYYAKIYGVLFTGKIHCLAQRGGVAVRFQIIQPSTFSGVSDVMLQDPPLSFFRRSVLLDGALGVLLNYNGVKDIKSYLFDEERQKTSIIRSNDNKDQFLQYLLKFSQAIFNKGSPIQESPALESPA